MPINFKVYYYQEITLKIEIQIDDQILSRNNLLKMLGVTLDENLNFNEHVRNICKTASGQINALKRISYFLNMKCRLDVYKSFINANFNYCPLVWMFCGKTNLKKLEKLQERALTTVYNDKTLHYQDLLAKSGQLSIRMNLLRLLAVEMFKCVNGINPVYLNEMFAAPVSNYNFRNQKRLLQPMFNTYRYGYKSFRYFGSKVWNILPYDIKNVTDLNVFKKEIFSWCLTEHASRILALLDL